MNEWMDGWMNGRMNESLNRCMDRQMGEGIDGWPDRCTGVWTREMGEVQL